MGVHRTLRFIKWLPAFGWEPIVLTTANGKVSYLDDSLLEKVPETVEVHRTHSFELLNYGTSIDASTPRRLPPIVSRLCCELPRDAWKLTAIPDEKKGWVPYAIREGESLIRSRQIDAIYVSGKPFSSYSIGEALGRKCNIPWLMDLRDLWTLNRRNCPAGRLRMFLEKRLERQLVHSAAVVIANTPDNRLDFISAFPECNPRKFVDITNGYDKDDFAGWSVEKYDKFTIAYSGRFYFPRRSKPGIYRRLLSLDRRKPELLETYSPKFFFQALAQLFCEQPELRDRIQMVISGDGCRKAGGLVDEFGLADNVKLLGWLSYRDSLEMLKRAHASLIVLSRGVESKGWIPSKLFQYLGAGNPLLAMVPGGDVKDIIVNTGSGVAVESDDVAGIKRAVGEMYDRYYLAEESYHPRWDAVEQYEAKQLTGRLANCLEIACAR